MADVMKFELVSPERKLASIEATMVQIPGSEGDFTAMANHTPNVSTLRPGILRAVAQNGDITEYVVFGGFAEISETGTTVLAESAVLKAEATSEFLDGALKEAEARLEAQTDNAIEKASAELALNDVKSLLVQLS